MKFAYDISILGSGYINPKARTGIFRVVESLFFELISSYHDEIVAVNLNKNSSIWDYYSSKLYLQTFKPELENILLSNYQSNLNLQLFYLSAVRLQRHLVQANLQKKSFLYKLSLGLRIPFDYLSKIDVNFKFNPNKYDIYHSCYYPLPQKSFLQHLPRILTIYDMIPIKFANFMNKRKCRLFFSTINSIDINHDWIISISQNTKNDFCEYTGMNPERVFVTPLAAASHFYPVQDSNLIASTLKQYAIPESPYLLSLCTLEPRKNLSFLIKCFSKIIADNPSLDLNLVLVGVNGWKNNEIFQAAAENPQLKSRIIFTGYVPDEDLSAIYSGATAFVYPSLYEGFGLPPLEAMQCGTPVITSNTSSLPEVVGDAGIAIDPKQEDELCHALLKVINDSELRTTLSQKGIERAKQFSWSKCAEETVKVYQIATN
jgi:glycosyltransferase involved in cell wall biosynthesis